MAKFPGTQRAVCKISIAAAFKGKPYGSRNKLTDCSLRQGARPLKGTYKGDFYVFVLIFKVFVHIV